MITIDLMGGLGNQLFQYAFGRALGFNGRDVQYDPSLVLPGCGRILLLPKVQINLKLNRKVASQGPAVPVVHEASLRFDRKYFTVDNCILHGYWQSEKYSDHIEGVIRKEVFNGMATSDRTREVAKEILYVGEHSCFLHVRRTDNLRPAGLTVHGLVNAPECKYYERAIAHMRRRIPGVHFFVFSDDPVWIHENMRDADMTVVNHNPMSGYADARHEIVDREGGTENEDLWLMSLCRHAIIANSTFSWWGAWLHPAQEKRIVTAPDPWFATSDLDSTDIVPDRWTKIPIL